MALSFANQGPCGSLESNWCQRCSEAISSLFRNSSSESIGSIDSLIEKSQSRCRICSIILSEIQESAHTNVAPSQDREAHLHLKVTNRDTPMRVEIVTAQNQQRLGELIISTEDPGTPTLPPIMPHVVDSQTFFSHPHWGPTNATATPELMRLWIASHMAAWLSKCNAEHGNSCNRSFGTDLPTRLIHVQEDRSLKLVHTQNLETAEAALLSYVSVSHVWGTTEMLKLTTENIDSFRHAIPFDGLVRKFREVIDLATAIGIRYLWIDTLCIIQNSKADWKREAGRMAAVYQNATLNLAAVGGSATDACLTSRNILGLYRAVFSVEHPSLGRIPLYLSRSNGLVSRMFNLTEQRPPVLKRGWIWQERFLSRRTAYLGETQLAWECGRCLWLESTGFADHFGELAIWTYCKRTLHGEMPRNWSFLPDDGDGGGLSRWKSHWDNFTAAYTDAGLTHTTDKLAAVAGIAKAFQKASLHTYAAGMWKEHIQIGSLLWKTDSRTPRPTTFRGAPSWAWASVDGALSYGGVFVRKSDGLALHVPRTELVGLDITPPDDPDAIFGEVKEAIVRVRGRLFRTEYEPMDSRKKLRILRLAHVVSKAEGGGVGVEGTWFGGFRERDFDATFDAPVEGNGVPLVVLCVLSIVDSYLDGLILTRAEISGLYERVGIFRFSGREYSYFQELADAEETVVSLR